MTDRELMQQALDALKLIDEAMPFPVAKLTIKNLREKLAQTEQEPVAIYRAGQAPNENYHVQFFKHMTADEVLLYTTPPQRKPLTDEEIYKIANDLFYGNGPCDTLALCRAIEAAHGIKGDA